MTRAFSGCLASAVPVLTVSLGCHIHTHAHAQDSVCNTWVQQEVCRTVGFGLIGMNITAQSPSDLDSVFCRVKGRAILSQGESLV